MKTITLKIQDMHCTSCAMNIDGELEDTEGVLSSSTNYAKSLTQVEFDEGKVSADKLLETVKRAGYNANVMDKIDHD